MNVPKKSRFDLIDAHVYGGALLVSVGAGLWHVGAGLVVFGAALFYLGVRH